MGFHLLLPLLPLGLEFWRAGILSAQSTTLVAAMYAISIGVSSRSKLLFGLSIIISIVFSIASGSVVGGGVALPGCTKFALTSIAALILTHGIERYNRHVAERRPFWIFEDRAEG